MRGPNKVKKTAEMKAQQRADRSARQAAKQRGELPQSGEEGQQQVGLGVGVGVLGGQGQTGEMDLTLDTASRYDHFQAGDDKNSRMKQQQQQQQQHDYTSTRRQDYMTVYGTDGLGRDSYDRTGQQAGQYFSLAPDPSGNNFGYQPSTAGSGGTDYYSSFSRANEHDPKSARSDDHNHNHNRDPRVAGRDIAPRPPQIPMIDDRLSESTEADRDRARLVSLIGAGTRFDPAIEGGDGHQHNNNSNSNSNNNNNDSPGRNQNASVSANASNIALAAYLLPPEGEGEGENGDYSPGGTGDAAVGGQW